MAQIVAEAPSFSTKTPDVLHTAGVLSFSIPVLNTGTGPANDLIITAITLGPALRVGPALPLPLGDLGTGNVTAVNAGFAANGLMVGSRYLASVRGTYQSGNTRYGFTLNRYIVVPASVSPPVPFLAAHLLSAPNTSAGTWSYTLFNDEPANSPRFINAVSIDMAAPFSVTGTPEGWGVDTDNLSYVFWYAADPALPYPHHVAPGASQGGFQIQSARSASESRGFSLTSWNHQTDAADLTLVGTTLTPSRT